MSQTIINAAPRPVLRGIKDSSGRAPVNEPDLIPTHLPHVYVFAERGPTLPQLVSGDSMIRMYGKPTFDYRKKYATHQTVMANMVNAEANRMMVQRLVPAGANPAATMRLSVDVSCGEDIEVFSRNPDGSFLIDADGAKVPTGDIIQGCKIRWLVGPTIAPADDGRLLESGDPRLNESGISRILETSVGQGAASVGFMTNPTGIQSTIYPIMDLEASSFGDWGNRLGVKLSAPTINSTFPADAETIEEQKAYLFRIQLTERNETNSSSKVLETLFGEQFVDFTFKRGVINPRTETELHIDRAVVPAYGQDGSAGQPEIIPAINKIHVYESNLDQVLTNIQLKEAPFGIISDKEEDKHLVNIFGAHDHNGIPYESIRVMGPADDGILLGESSTHYLQGGYDGVMSFDNYDKAVQHQLLNYGDLEAKLMDSAFYPQSVIYDTGFTLATKKAMFVPMGRRKDLYVVVTPQDASQPQNTPSEETSIAVALRTAARMYPESVVYGTSTCRAIVMGHSGELLQSTYTGLLPITVEFAQKCAAYMGAGTGFWKNSKKFDSPPNNQVKLFKNVNAEWLSSNARSKQWDAGLVWVQNYDRRSLFFPAVQTVYDDDSSVLNSAANMMIVVELEKIAERVWRDLTGISYLTPGQFIERSDNLIDAEARGKFDGRAIIVPETHYTQVDDQRGYSWSCNIHMYAPNMKTVGSFTIVAHRIKDYPG